VTDRKLCSDPEDVIDRVAPEFEAGAGDAALAVAMGAPPSAAEFELCVQRRLRRPGSGPGRIRVRRDECFLENLVHRQRQLAGREPFGVNLRISPLANRSDSALLTGAQLRSSARIMIA
jgi:hypothetical protein